MKVTCATYNILHGYHRDMILKNIRFLIDEGADVICLQETSPEFEKEAVRFLKREGLMHWKAEFVHKGAGGHVGLLWNTYKLSLIKTHIILLPSLGKLSGIQRLKGSKEIYQRVALLGQFYCKGEKFNVVSTHLAWEGGVMHRFRQIKALRKRLETHVADCDIVGGDFNTIGPKIVGHVQKKRLEKIFGTDFVNVLPRLKWSFDTAFIDPSDTWKVALRFRRVGVRFRSRLDYIFCRNLRVLKADMHDLPGSDHRPLIATFVTAPVSRKNKKVVV